MEETKQVDNVQITQTDRVHTDVLDAVLGLADAPASNQADAVGAMPMVRVDDALQRFFGREVVIGNVNWVVGGNLYFTVNPFQSFLTSAAVAEKLRYYMRFRAKMVVKVVLSATPFHYGKAIAVCRPHPGLEASSDPIFNLSAATESPSSDQNLTMVLSQMSGADIQPSYTKEVVVDCPYVHYRPGIELATGLYGDVCTFVMKSQTVLRHANGGTDPVNLRILVHAEDVEMDVPTSVYYPQGFTLSDAASTLGAAMSLAGKATDIAGERISTVGNVLSQLGFSRPPILESPVQIQNRPYNMANGDGYDTVETLALASDQEVVLDPSCVGDAQRGDPLLFSNLAARPSYLGSRTWTSDNASGTFLWGMLVTPQQQSVSTYQKVNGVTLPHPSTHVQFTPSAWCAAVFDYARYDFVVRITAAASPYHKGRLRIFWDPTLAVLGSTPYNLNEGVVLDLSESNSLEFRVPWQNVRDAVRMDLIRLENFFADEASFDVRVGAATSETCNGQIRVEVLSPLTGPVDGADVSLVVESWCENFVGYSPALPVGEAKGNQGTLSFLSTVTSDMEATPYAPASFDITGGDAVISARQLIKRYNYEYTRRVASETGGDGRIIYLCLPVKPPIPGEVTNAADSLDNDPDAVPNLRVNYTGWLFSTWFAQAFGLERGSYRKKIMINTKNSSTFGPAETAVTRFQHTAAQFGGAERKFSLVRGSAAFSSFKNDCVTSYNVGRAPLGSTGNQVSSVSGSETAIHDVALPYMSMYRARTTRGLMVTGCADGSDECNYVVSVPLASSTSSYAIIRVWGSVGEDYNVFCFIHAPAVLMGFPGSSAIS